MQSIDVESPAALRGPGRVRGLAAIDGFVALTFLVSLLIYVPTYVRLYNGPWQTEQEGHGPLILLAIAIIPITVAANILRVAALVLLSYYLGADAVEGLLHDFTGIFLFVVAIGLFFGLDLVLIFLSKLAFRPAPRPA